MVAILIEWGSALLLKGSVSEEAHSGERAIPGWLD